MGRVTDYGFGAHQSFLFLVFWIDWNMFALSHRHTNLILVGIISKIISSTLLHFQFNCVFGIHFHSELHELNEKAFDFFWKKWKTNWIFYYLQASSTIIIGFFTLDLFIMESYRMIQRSKRWIIERTNILLLFLCLLFAYGLLLNVSSLTKPLHSFYGLEISKSGGVCPLNQVYKKNSNISILKASLT